MGWSVDMLRNLIRFSLLLLLAQIALALTAACGARAPQDNVTLVYPSPPDEPRIVYLKSYRGEGDFIKPGFWDLIFGTVGSSTLSKPYGVFALEGRIYATLTGSGGVIVIDTKNRKVDYLGSRFSLPMGLTGTRDGMIFVSDATQKKVFGYDAKGSLRVAIGKKDEFQNPAGIAVNDDLQRLYVVDSFKHKVRVYSTKGEALFEFGRNGPGDGEFHYPSNVAVDRRTGNVYIVDTQNFRVQVFNKDGKFLRKFGEIGDRPGFFARPKGISVDSDGHVYVADAAFDNFQVFDETGQVLLFIGSVGSDPGLFQLPASLYVDEQDKVYVVDSMNGRIQVFQYLSEKWKKEHPEEYKKYVLSPLTVQ
jgi:DNA-binding beta-propeller fold protein YncE